MCSQIKSNTIGYYFKRNISCSILFYNLFNLTKLFPFPCFFLVEASERSFIQNNSNYPDPLVAGIHLKEQTIKMENFFHLKSTQSASSTAKLSNSFPSFTLCLTRLARMVSSSIVPASSSPLRTHQSSS